MAKRAELTVDILRQIRDEIVGVRTEVRDTRTALSERIDQTNDKLDTLARRQTESEVRLATELIEVSRAVNGVRDLLRERLDDRERIDDHERRLTAIERRTA